MGKRKEWNGHEGVVLDIAGEFDVIDCFLCGFKHVIPIPDADKMAKYYSKEFIARRPKIAERIREDLDWWKLVYSRRLKLLKNNVTGSARKILDVGCGLGFFLKEASEKGWSTLGIEPSKQAFEHAIKLGVDVVNDTLNLNNYKKLGRFDVVHMHEVLEHVPDPEELIRMAWEMLEPGGVVLIISPNDYNPFQLALREHLGFKPWWVAPPEHINYFSFDSLEALLNRTGFDVVRKSTTFPMEIFLLMEDNYVGNDALGRDCHGKRKNFEMNLEKGLMADFQERFNEFLSSCGVGREIVILAKKREV